MNTTFSGDPQLSFLTDFSEDVAERRAMELAVREAEEEDAA
jgi:hypothetical protein